MLLEQPGELIARDAHPARLVERVHHLAVHVELELADGGIADAHGHGGIAIAGCATRDPAPVAGLAEEGGEARAGVEAGKTQPVDRSVPSHEGGRLRVAEDGVVFYAHKP